MNTSTNTQIQSSGAETPDAATKPAHYPETLPFQKWCRCGHISGQHGVRAPHACTIGFCECRKFEGTKGTHTPGPWKIATHLNEPCTIYVQLADGEEPGICTTDGSDFTPVDSEEEQEANARLLAAAPELLDALEALTDPEGHIYHGPNAAPGECPGECKAVRAAIAKAKGGAQ